VEKELNINLKNSKKAVVEIKGGFGNQIFQYMFAKKLKNEGYDVKINTRFYNQFNETALPKDTFRNLILPPSYFGFKEIGGLFYKLLVINNKISKSRKIKKLIKKFENPFYIHVKDKNIENMPTNKIIYHFDGYWQNINNLVSEKSYLIESLSKNEVLDKSISMNASRNSAMLIVRRGDYLSMNEELSISFYTECIEYFNSKIENLQLSIFTDDIEWVKKQNIFLTAKNIYGPEESPEKVLELFSLMLNNFHFAVTNSTFSLIAAVISERTESIILVADPWFKNRYFGKLVKENWIKIDNI